MESKTEPEGSPGDPTSPEGALKKKVMSESQGKGTKASGELADYDGTYTPPAEVSFPQCRFGIQIGIFIDCFEAIREALS